MNRAIYDAWKKHKAIDDWKVYDLYADYSVAEEFAEVITRF
jgi:hypothetical protein